MSPLLFFSVCVLIFVCDWGVKCLSINCYHIFSSVDVSIACCLLELCHNQLHNSSSSLLYQARKHLVYWARGALGERERQTERQRRKCRHHSGAEFGDEFAFSLAKSLHFSSSPLKWLWAHTFRCQKKVVLFVLPLSHGAASDRRTETRDRIFGCTVLLSTEKQMNQTNIKIIGNRKRDCAWGCAGG